jgi:predicted ATPase/DNA-binding XRE family transcriptional regulator
MADSEPSDTMQRGELSFGVRLRQLRAAAGLTQEELASRSGLTAKAISVLERGERQRPYPHTVRALAQALDLSDDERAALFAAVPTRGHGADAVDRATTAESNLPWPATPLLGREREREELRTILREGRLLTLTGPAGVGKTRLAIQIARDTQALFPDGTVFVALAPVSHFTAVIPTTVHALGVSEREGQTPGEALRASLRERRMLVVLDNFEHVLEAAAEVMGLIESCPNLRVLATSRAPLRVRGEREYPVPPLALPRSTVSPSVEEVLGSAAGRLFAERARAAFAAFELTPQNSGAVAAICWRLSGLPLALELVAARARFLDPATLLAGLDRALSVSWARDPTGRHQTMWAALDWSHDLLSEEEQMVFRCLSVCRGGFSLEMAAAVGVPGSGATESVVEILGRLVEQSLVEADRDEQDGGLRYGMLEPVRQYAREKLEAGGTDRETEQQHLAYFLGLTEEADRTYGLLTGMRLAGTPGEAWINRLACEHDNLRAALRCAKEQGDVTRGLRLAGAMSWFWWMRGYFSEGRQWIETFLELAEHSTIRIADQVRAKALLGGGLLALAQGDLLRSTTLVAEGLTIYRGCGDSTGIAATSALLGHVKRAAGDDAQATALSEEALQWSRTLNDDRSAAISLSTLGHVARRRGDLHRAADRFGEALAHFERLGDRRGVAYSFGNLGIVALAGGEAQHALELHEESVRLYAALHDEAGRGYALINLGDVARFLGEEQRAVALYEEALAVHRQLGAARGTARALKRLDAVHSQRNDQMK